jgi:hypothetical protein
VFLAGLERLNHEWYGTPTWLGTDNNPNMLMKYIYVRPSRSPIVILIFPLNHPSFVVPARWWTSDLESKGAGDI